MGKSEMKQPMWIFLAVFALVFSSAANATPGDIHIARENGVEVYDTPSYAAQVLITLDEGRKLKELKREGPWIKVIVYGELGKDGWVYSSSVAPESAGTENAAKPIPVVTGPLDPFLLVVTGTPRQQFKAICQNIDRNRDRKTINITGQLPKEYAIKGIAVRCRVYRLARYAGMLSVTLKRQWSSEPIVAAQTTATNGCVSIRTKGRWGVAWGKTKCSRSATF